MTIVSSASRAPFAPVSERLARFRDASRARGAQPPAGARTQHFLDAFFGRHSRRPFWERYARSLGQALEQEPVSLFADEQLVGMLYQGVPEPGTDPSLAQRWAEYSPAAYIGRRAGGIHPFVGVGYAPGHVGWRWDVILAEGIDGLVKRLRGHLREARDAKAKRLYRGALSLWASVLRWNDQHVAALEARAAACGDAAEQARLTALAQLCRRVPRQPARTFHEAVQAFYFQHLAVMFEDPYGGNGPGRLDYFLWPYLERDLAAGQTTMAAARDLIDELFVRLHERVQLHDGWVEAIMVGGSRPDGTSSLNPLSSLCLESIGALDQTHPSVYCRVSVDDPPEFLDLNVNYLLHGRNRAQIYNENAMLPAIVASGVPRADATMYMAGGCMEVSVQGAACDLNFCRVVNVAKLLELVLNGGVDLLSGTRQIPHSRSLADYPSFAALYADFEAVLSWYFGEMARALDLASEAYARLRPCYLLSSLVQDCLARGREQQQGGARYHDYGFAFVGLTSAADSLHAIDQAVFGERFVSGAKLLAALRRNYDGCEPLRRRLSRIARYGVGEASADAMADRVLASACGLATAVRTRFGGQLKPMLFNFVWTPGESRRLGARADGLRAGERIGHGVTPQPQAMTQGLTAAMNSCLALDCSVVSGGATTMWDLAPDLARFDVVKVLLRRFLAGGGMILQGNMTDVAELEAARRDPAAYPNLIVRVGGFSARFVTLSTELQDEILTRYRHAR